MFLQRLRSITTAMLVALSVTSLASADPTGNMPLIHIGLNVGQCSGPTLGIGSTNGVVTARYMKGEKRLVVIIAVHDAVPNTTYVINVRCMAAIGAFTTDSTGLGSAQISVNLDNVPSKYYIDISVPNVGGSSANGDTFVAGPF